MLAGGVAHDFNNLLVGILGNAEIILDDTDADSPHLPLLTDVIAAAERAAELTRQLLDYAQLSPMRPEPVDLSDLVESTHTFLRSIVPQSVNLTFDTPAALPMLLADRSQLTQIIVNLVSNAAEALTDHLGDITVRTFTRSITATPDSGTPSPFVCLEVTDTGHGMDTATIDQMFQPFFTTKFTGRGLGLAAVHGIVAASNGTIDVHSIVDHGTTITVQLPAPQADRDPGPAD